MPLLSTARAFSAHVCCAALLSCALIPALATDQPSSSTTKKTTSQTAKRKPHKSTAASKSGSTTKTAATTHTASSKRSTHRKKSTKVRGQQKIDSDRARSIQEALIRQHYLSGEPAGTWNQASEDAMRRYQADHGWQSKTVPDSRALISLGLGPSKDHLLNPESAMTTGPETPKAESLPSTSHPATPVSSSPNPAQSQADPPNNRK